MNRATGLGGKLDRFSKSSTRVVFTAIMLSIMALVDDALMACRSFSRSNRGFRGNQELEIREDGF